MLRSLTAMAEDGGAMPRWPLGTGYTGGMVGDPAAMAFADSYVKGIRDFDLRAAYDALSRSATGTASDRFGGRGNADVYGELGYVPIESAGGSASKTLEFAYADWALAILADALGETRRRGACSAIAPGAGATSGTPTGSSSSAATMDGTFSTTSTTDSGWTTTPRATPGSTSGTCRTTSRGSPRRWAGATRSSTASTASSR